MDGIAYIGEKLVETFSRVDWGPYAPLGLVLLALSIAVRLAGRSFFDFLIGKWLFHRSTNPAPPVEPVGTTLRKFLLPMLGREPNEEFKPYLPYVVPVTVAEIASFVVGIFLLSVKTLTTFVVLIFVLSLVYAGCFMLARWQVKHNRW